MRKTLLFPLHLFLLVLSTHLAMELNAAEPALADHRTLTSAELGHLELVAECRRAISMMRWDGKAPPNPMRLPISVIDDWLPNYLDSGFGSLPRRRVRQGAVSVRKAENHFLDHLEASGFNRARPHQTLTHSYLDTGIQAFIVSWILPTPAAREVAAELESYYAHFLDDDVDRKYAARIAEILLNHPQPQLEEILAAIAPWHLKFWNIVTEYAKGRLPYFQKGEFEFAMLRMIYGSPMFAAKIPEAQRTQLQIQHRTLLANRVRSKELRKIALQLDPRLLAATTKVLFEEIMAFREERVDPDVAFIFNVLLAPALMEHDAKAEIKSGELVQIDNVSKLARGGDLLATFEPAIRKLDLKAGGNDAWLIEFYRGFLDSFLPIAKHSGLQSYYKRILQLLERP